MPYVLVTGGTGMVGSTMVDYILAEHTDYDVVAMGRVDSNLKNVTQVLDHPRVHWEVGDLLDLESLKRILTTYNPVRCFHTAGMSHVPTAWGFPQDCMQVNVIDQINLLEAIRIYVLNAVFRYVAAVRNMDWSFRTKCPLKRPIRCDRCHRTDVVKSPRICWVINTPRAMA